MIKHKHHIIPKHMGGSDDPSNLIELTIEEHADAHRKLYEKYGYHQDMIAWKALSGQITNSEAARLAISLRDTSYMQTEEYRQKISKANKGKIPWNKGGGKPMKGNSGGNHYSSVAFHFRGKRYSCFKDAIKETGISRYKIKNDPSFILDMS